MTNCIFPKLRGLSWSVHERPQTSTRISKHVSGREVRAQLYKYPLYEFELTYGGLSASADPAASNLGAQSLQTLEAFWLARGGAFDTFLFRKADATGHVWDSQAEGQLLGIGDGVTTDFVFLRQLLTTWSEPVGAVESLGLNVYVGGMLQPASAWSLVYPNLLSFASAPALAAQVTADYSFYFLCRFGDDTTDFENFAYNLWTNQSVKLQTVKYP
jgi:uncharacterized protein (TIGR02217 family)